MNAPPFIPEIQSSAPSPSLEKQPLHGHGDPGGFRVRTWQAAPLFLAAALLDPLRLLLRPLVHWLREPHSMDLADQQFGEEPAPVQLTSSSLIPALLTLLLGPLIFLLLLPLLLILAPVLLLIVLAGALAVTYDLPRPATS